MGELNRGNMRSNEQRNNELKVKRKQMKNINMIVMY